MALTISRSASIKVLQGVGFRDAAKWSNEELEKKLMGVEDIVDDPSFTLPDPDADMDFRDVIGEIEEKGQIDVVDGDEVGEQESPAAAEPEPEPKSKKSRRAKKKPGRKANKDAEKAEDSGSSSDDGEKESKVVKTDVEKKLSQLEAAIKIMGEEDHPMKCPELVLLMEKKGYWKTTTGKTPAATLNASFVTEIRKGADSRIVKPERGLYALTD